MTKEIMNSTNKWTFAKLSFFLLPFVIFFFANGNSSNKTGIEIATQDKCCMNVEELGVVECANLHQQNVLIKINVFESAIHPTYSLESGDILVLLVFIFGHARLMKHYPADIYWFLFVSIVLNAAQLTVSWTVSSEFSSSPFYYTFMIILRLVSGGEYVIMECTRRILDRNPYVRSLNWMLIMMGKMSGLIGGQLMAAHLIGVNVMEKIDDVKSFPMRSYSLSFTFSLVHFVLALMVLVCLILYFNTSPIAQEDDVDAVDAAMRNDQKDNDTVKTTAFWRKLWSISKQIFNPVYLNELHRAMIQPRPDERLKQFTFWPIIFLLSMDGFTVAVLSLFMFSYSQLIYEWSPAEFLHWHTMNTAIASIGAFGCLWFLAEKCHFKLTTILGLAHAGALAYALIRGTLPYASTFYWTLVLCPFPELIIVTCGELLKRRYPDESLGAINMSIYLLKECGRILASLSITYVYYGQLTTCPEVFFYVSAGGVVACVPAAVYVYWALTDKN